MKKIIYTQDDGVLAVITPAPGFSIDDVRKDIPVGKIAEVIEEEELPQDRMFRNAWVQGTDKKPKTDQNKAKEIAHGYRRNKRQKELEPLDKEINYSISNPGKIQQLENDRANIRAKHDRIQTDIDATTTEEELRTIVITEELI